MSNILDKPLYVISPYPSDTLLTFSPLVNLSLATSPCYPVLSVRTATLPCRTTRRVKARCRSTSWARAWCVAIHIFRKSNSLTIFAPKARRWCRYLHRQHVPRRGSCKSRYSLPHFQIPNPSCWVDPLLGACLKTRLRLDSALRQVRLRRDRCTRPSP